MIALLIKLPGKDKVTAYPMPDADTAVDNARLAVYYGAIFAAVVEGHGDTMDRFRPEKERGDE